MRYATFAHFVGVGATRYGDDVEVLKGGGDAAIIETYMDAKKHPTHSLHLTETLDERWAKVRAVFEKYEFIPFDEKVSCLADPPISYTQI